MSKVKMSLYDWAKSASENEWILEQFDYDQNYPFTPKDFGKASGKKVYFKFPCGHSRLQCIADKTSKNSRGCPLCLNRGGVGKSLADIHIDYELMNDEVNPENIPVHSGERYLWKCTKCGNVFEGRVADITSGKRVCSRCKNKKISTPQYCIYFYMKQIDSQCEINQKIEGYRYDIYSPKYKLAIEFDGIWHDSEMARKNDVIKDEICEKLNVHILRIRDVQLEVNDELKAIIWNYVYDRDLEFLKDLPKWLKRFGIRVDDLDVDVKRDMDDIQAFRKLSENEKSLVEHMPEIVNYIDVGEMRNGKNPERISVASHSIRIWLRDPEYPNLKWSQSVHELFQKKTPHTQWITMCRKMLKRYPQLDKQIYQYGNNIRSGSEFKLRCSCGKEFVKKYVALMDKGKLELCPECVRKLRLKNLGRL